MDLKYKNNLHFVNHPLISHLILLNFCWDVSISIVVEWDWLVEWNHKNILKIFLFLIYIFHFLSKKTLRNISKKCITLISFIFIIKMTL